MRFTRRNFLAGLAGLPLLGQWTQGSLEIHHLSTGRGNCTLILCPDGTVMMIDAGAQMPNADEAKYLVPAYPNGSRRPGEWMARYAKRQMARVGRNEIDHFFLTHFHSDHMGQFRAELPKSSRGDFRLTGLIDVAEAIPVRKLYDRGFPNYNYPAPLNDAMVKNYRAFVTAAPKLGTQVEAFRPGSDTQMTLVRSPKDYPNFEVRNIVANGELWTGKGTETKQMFPPVTSLQPKEYPSENMCSGGVRIRYGAFDYFHGGDLCDGAPYGVPAWRNIETAAAKVAGPVDVALASHHGYIDSTGPDVVRALRPRAFVIHAWDSAHPTMPALHNMLSEELYPGPRDIYSTALKDEARIAIKKLDQLKSSLGHVVVKVAPGGASWEVLITSNADESDAVTARFGPYSSTN